MTPQDHRRRDRAMTRAALRRPTPEARRLAEGKNIRMIAALPLHECVYCDGTGCSKCAGTGYVFQIDGKPRGLRE